MFTNTTINAHLYKYNAFKLIQLSKWIDLREEQVIVFK
jgi:hypothetical protein